MSIGTLHYLYCDSCGEEADVHDRLIGTVKKEAKKLGFVRLPSGFDLCAECFKNQRLP